MAYARRIVTNPANKQQHYILWSNGYLQPVGGALPVTQAEASVNSPSSNAPTFYTWSNPDIAASVVILDWTIPRGYTLTVYGHIWPWGGATTTPGASAIPYPGTAPEYLFGLNGAAFASPIYGYVSDFKMDPGNSGLGYYLTYKGDVVAFGTGVTAVTHAAFLTDAGAAQLVMDWTSKRYWILDTWGRVWGFNGAASNPAVVDVNGASATAPAYAWGRGGNLPSLRLYDVTASAKGWMQDGMGRMYAVGGAQFPYGYIGSNTTPQNIAGDFDIVDDGTGANPLRLIQMGVAGSLTEFVSSTAPVANVNAPTLLQSITDSSRPYIAWYYFDREGDGQAQYEVKVISSAVYTVGTTNEVQTVTITGTPTGGNFFLTFNGQTTAAIPYNSVAGTVQTALNNLTNIGANGVAVTGGPGPGTPYTVTFSGTQMAGWNWPQMTATHTFTGGASPAIAVTTATQGVGIDAYVASNVFSTSGTDLNTRRVQVGSDLANATYRAYVRVTDTSGLNTGNGLNGGWSYTHFTISLTALSQPTVVPGVNGGLGGISLAVSATTGAGLPGTARFLVQYSDDGTNWYTVRGCDALVPSGGGTATGIDYEAPFGKQRSYRAYTYVYSSSTDAWQASAVSTTANATLTPKTQWALTLPGTTAKDMIVSVTDGFSPTRDIVNATYKPVGRQDPVVITDGAPKYPSFEVSLWALDNTTRTKIEAMLNADQVLLLRDPFGNVWYFKPVDNWSKDLLRAGPLLSETTVLRDANKIKFKAQSVKRPVAGMSAGPLKES